MLGGSSILTDHAAPVANNLLQILSRHFGFGRIHDFFTVFHNDNAIGDAMDLENQYSVFLIGSIISWQSHNQID